MCEATQTVEDIQVPEAKQFFLNDFFPSFRPDWLWCRDNTVEIGQVESCASSGFLFKRLLLLQLYHYF
jgi:hypothetical protein